MISVVIILVVALTAWFYFNKFTESEKAFKALHKKYSDLKSDSCRLKERITDLDAYKTDVSKTFKILDNELISINNEIKKTHPENNIQDPTTSDAISILSPEFLNSLFNNINQEQPINDVDTDVKAESEVKVDDELPSNYDPELPSNYDPVPTTLSSLPSNYDEFIINNDT